MIAPAYVELARRQTAALNEADARRMIDAGLELEEKRKEQRRTSERVGHGRRLADLVVTDMEESPEV